MPMHPSEHISVSETRFDTAATAESVPPVHLSYAGFFRDQRLCGVTPKAGPRAVFVLSADPKLLDSEQICTKCKTVLESELKEND